LQKRDLAVQFEAGAEDWEGWRMLHTANKGRKPSTEAGKKCLNPNVLWSALVRAVDFQPSVTEASNCSERQRRCCIGFLLFKMQSMWYKLN